MHRVLFTSLDAAIAGLILAPIFWFMNKKYFRSNIRTLFYLLFAVYLCAIFAVAGLPDIRYMRFRPNINIKPFAYMFSDSTSSLLNVILFLPMGFLLPVLWKNYLPLYKTVLFGLGASVLIETLQIFTYRATDINDLMTNTAGTVIGWCFARLILGINKKQLPDGNPKDLIVTCCTAFFVMFFVHPFVSEIFFLIL